MSMFSDYATKTYADNVANNAEYQASVYTDSRIGSLSSVYAELSADNHFTGSNQFSGTALFYSSAYIGK